MITLNTTIINISRVGKATAKKLAKIDINTVNDLLFYFPHRYDDFSRTTLIKDLKNGDRVNITGQIELIQNKRSFKKRMSITEALINDGTGKVKVVWFNQPFIARNLKVGDIVSLAGKAEDSYTGLSMSSPIYEKITSRDSIHTRGIIPNYHLTSNLTQKQIRSLIKEVVQQADLIIDWLPADIIKQQDLLPLNEAIKKIHFPRNWQDVNTARDRLAFNELLLIQLRSRLIKKQLTETSAFSISFKEKETKQFVSSLPFSLTPAQKKSAWEIIQDMKRDKPMSRLLEGDVGSGKTIVAVMAMLNVSLNKKQSALMAPTEILAKQHFDTVCRLLQKYNFKIHLLTRNYKENNYNQPTITQNKEKNVQEADIIIGTHSLIQEKFIFKNLALAIIDEQHRFGVEQRKTLLEKSDKKLTPHLLSMTATPIPRTLALALYSDLDLSIIDQMPNGRKTIMTKVISEAKRAAAYNFIRKQINEGRQAFVICPLIDISDNLGVKSVKEEFKKLDEIIFPDVRIGMLHGKLKPAEKTETMQAFKNNEIKIIVSTSVVEVGVDVPNATIMMIEGADRFGLAQLHQFRGRVGRSSHQSYCFLFTDSGTDKTIERLSAMEKYNDGFTLSKIDLKFRGPGELYGLAQKGFPELKIASLFDYALIKKAHEVSGDLINSDKIKKLPELLTKVKENINIIHPE